MARRLADVMGVVLALGLAGCGAQAGQDSSGEFTGDERLVAQAVEDLQRAASRGETERLCNEVLARDLARQLARQGSGDDCPSSAQDAIRDADSFELTVEDVEVTSGRATARVRAEAGERDETQAIELVREGDRWKVSALPGAS